MAEKVQSRTGRTPTHHVFRTGVLNKGQIPIASFYSQEEAQTYIDAVDDNKSLYVFSWGTQTSRSIQPSGSQSSQQGKQNR